MDDLYILYVYIFLFNSGEDHLCKLVLSLFFGMWLSVFHSQDWTKNYKGTHISVCVCVCVKDEESCVS